MIERKITSANADDEQLKQLYQTAFPENEQIPWDDLMRLIGEMSLDFTAYYDGDAFIGFTIVYPRPSFNRRNSESNAEQVRELPSRDGGRQKVNWYWYFAVREDLRGKGLGQQILTQLIERYKGQRCVLDMESPEQNPCPNPEQRQRRHAFYLRNGFRDTHVYRKYDDTEMTIMMMGDDTLAFTIEDWDEITSELKQHWNWEEK